MSSSIKNARLQNDLKNPIIALVLGIVVPGGAQMYAGNVKWGVINLILAVICAITIVLSPVTFIIWLVSIFYGYKGTKEFNTKILDAAEEKERQQKSAFNTATENS